MSCAEHFRKAFKNRRQKIIIMCEPRDTNLIEEALNKIDYAKAQGIIHITYEPSLSVKGD